MATTKEPWEIDDYGTLRGNLPADDDVEGVSDVIAYLVNDKGEPESKNYEDDWPLIEAAPRLFRFAEYFRRWHKGQMGFCNCALCREVQPILDDIAAKTALMQGDDSPAATEGRANP